MGIKGTARNVGRSAFRRLPDSVRDRVKGGYVEMQGLGRLKENQALLALRLAQLEEKVSPPPAPEAEPADDRFPAGVRSRLCTQAQLSEPWFATWCAAFHEPPYAHRKAWEFAYIAQVLNTLGKLEP
ncbi:MAG TPA: hypothetical protein VG712_00765, partial [Gemmatimonadales bacterium]|nr:hypothetical protein [Gemmatimonadales bacterium]